MTKTDKQRIAELNDECRQNFAATMLTRDVASLPNAEQILILKKVGAFKDFTPENDPYEEHDFGAVEHAGQRYFWKIDYYDRTMTGGSEDPSDPAQTVRVLTIMRASDH